MSRDFSPIAPDRLSVIQSEAPVTAAATEFADRNRLEAVTLDQDLLPTSVAPELNFGEAVVARIGRGARALDQLNLPQQIAVKSVPEWLYTFASRRPDFRAPIARDPAGNLVLPDGSTKPLAQATVAEAYDTLPDDYRSFLLSRGIDKNVVVANTDNDLDRLDSYLLDTLGYIRTNDRAEQFARDHPVEYVLAGTTALLSNTIDPLTVGTVALSFATSVAAKQAVKAGVRSALAAGARSSVRQRVGNVVDVFATQVRQQGLLNALRAPANPTAARSVAYFLLTPGAIVGGAQGATQGYLQEFANDETMVLLGELETDYQEILGLTTGAAVGGLLGLAFGSLGSVSSGGNPPTVTLRHYRQHSPDSFTAQQLTRMNQRGRILEDEVLSLETVAALEDVDRLVSIYPESKRIALMETIGAMEDAGKEIDYANLGRYLRTLPTFDEAAAYLKTGADTPSRFVQLYTDLRNLRDQLADARISGKGIDTITSKISALEVEIDELQATEFSVNDSVDIPKLWASRVFAKALAPKDASAPAEAQKRFLDAVAGTFTEDEVKRGSPIPRTLASKAHRLLGLAGGDLWNPTAVARELSRGTTLKDHLILTAWAGVVDDTGIEHVLDGVAERGFSPTHFRYMQTVEVRRQAIANEAAKAVKTRVKAGVQTTTEDFGAQVFLHSAGLKISDQPDVIRVADMLTDWTRDIGQRGVRSGYLRSYDDNFVPVVVNIDTVKFNREQAVDTLSQRLARYFKSESFDPEVIENPLHINTLIMKGWARRAKKAVKDGDGNVVHPEGAVILTPEGERLFGTEVPATVGSLTADTLDAYTQALDLGLLRDAQLAVARRTALAGDPQADPQLLRLQRRSSDPDVGFVDTFVDSRGGRKIDQSFWYSPENIADGLVVTDIAEVINAYSRSTGYNVARQEAITDLFGAPINWHTLVGWLKEGATDRQRRAIEVLEKQEQISAGRFRVVGPTALAGTLGDTARAAIVNPTLAPAVLLTEGAVNLSRLMFSGADIRQMVKLTVNAGTALQSRKLIDRGIGWELDLNRRNFRHDIDRDLGNEGGVIGRVREGAARFADFTRVFGGEQIATSFVKNLAFNKAFAEIGSIRKAIPRLAELNDDTLNPKQFAAKVREIGMGGRVGAARRLRRAGLTEPDAVALFSRIQQESPRLLRGTYEEWQAWVAANVDPSQLETALDVLGRLRRYAVREAETFVTTATPNSIVRGDNAFLNTLSQFTSFPRAWYNRTLGRLTEDGVGTAAAYLGLYAIGEVSRTIFFDMVFNGKSPEVVDREWSEQPHEKMAQVLARIPLTGPISFLQTSLYNHLSGARFDTQSGPPSLGIVDQAVNTAFALGGAAVSGETMSPSEVRSLQRLIPGYNFWYSRILERSLTGFEADPDR